MPKFGVLTATGPVSAMEAVFAVRLDTWHNEASDETFYANDRPATLPFPVIGVFGLDNATRPQPLLPARAADCKFLGYFACFEGYSAKQLRSAYNATSVGDKDKVAIDGKGQTVAIYAAAGFDSGDIDAFTSENDIVKAHIIVDPSGLKRDGMLGVELETDLDIEAVLAIAPKATIHVYEMAATDDGIESFLSMVAQNNEHIASISFTACESDLGNDNAQKYAAMNARLASIGDISIFASSGDSGPYCSNGGSDKSAHVGVGYPASDPSVTAVGGTHLDLNQTAEIEREQAWDQPDQPSHATGKPLASGGSPESSDGSPAPGQSSFLRPKWQREIPGTQRVIPDVAADADANSGLRIHGPGDWTIGTGTSLATPLWAGIAALYNQYAARHKAPPLGLANPILYNIDKSDNPLFDVTSNQNGGKDLAGFARKGWDAATGLGSPNAYTLIHDGVRDALKSAQRTNVVMFEPFVEKPGPTGLWVPRPGFTITRASGTCDSGSPDDPGRASAFRCVSTDGTIGNGTPCFANEESGDPGAAPLCTNDPTSDKIVQLAQVPVGAQLPLQLANQDDSKAPPWFLLLGDDTRCHYVGFVTNTKDLPYDCGDGLGATNVDRGAPLWTVDEGPSKPNGKPGLKDVAVLEATY